MQIQLENQAEFNSFYEELEKYYNLLGKFKTKLKLISKTPYFQLLLTTFKTKNQKNLEKIGAVVITSYLVASSFEESFQSLLITDLSTPELQNQQQQIKQAAKADFLALLKIKQLPTKIQQEVLLLLATSEIFNIKGFRDFRLGFLKPLAQKAVKNALGAFEEKKEYTDLVCSLQKFVKNQKPISNTLNVILFDGGSFSLKDEVGMTICEEEIEQELELAKDLGCGYDDSLVSAVISLAPRRLIFHQNSAKSWKIPPLIKDVLVDQIFYCQGCKLCQGQSVAAKIVTKN